MAKILVPSTIWLRFIGGGAFDSARWNSDQLRNIGFNLDHGSSLTLIWSAPIKMKLLWILILNFSGKDAFDPEWKKSYPLYIFNGRVCWHIMGEFESSCDLDMFRFPFHTQVCRIDFGNIVDVDSIVSATYSIDYVDFDLFSRNQELCYAGYDIVFQLYISSGYGYSFYVITPLLACIAGHKGHAIHCCLIAHDRH